MLVSFFQTPEQVPSETLPDCAVVVDILRATTTIATALAAGAEAVQVFADLETLEQVSQAWPIESRIRSGERGGRTVEGFDLGNSPLDYTPERVAGKRIFMSTTNGTRALQCVQQAPVVVTAALINLGSVSAFLSENGFERIWIVGSGWEGSYSLEDSFCAGAIGHVLQCEFQPQTVGNDELWAALALYQQGKQDPVEVLRRSSHGQRLLRIGEHHEADLQYCAQISTLEILPRQKEAGVLARH
jgi:2-phosphosulfolactate phosphatase